jgi:hypothetical protein
MKQFINGFAIKVSKNKKNTFLEKLTTKRMQLNVLINFVSGSSNLVAAGFEMSKIIDQHEKPLGHGDYIKESWLECASCLFDGFPEKKYYSTHQGFASE